MRAYMAARIRVGAAVPGTEHDREVLVGTIATVQQQIWEIATAAAKAGGVVPMGFLLAANDMFDAFSAWNAVSQRHVPEVVMLLLFTTFAGMGFVMG
jgi:ABC-type phosphate/phosphonate transport system permease subunit